jgi:hypothetical protein
MTNEQAKFILSGYRPRGQDAEDPAFAEALKAMREDPALASWLERSTALDTAVSAKLAQIEPPSDLRGAILAGARVSRRSKRGPGTWGWVAAMAAAAALLFGVVSFHGTSEAVAGPAAFASFAIRDMNEGHHGSTGEPASALVAKLEVEGSSMPSARQIDFTKLKSTGCRTLSFAGHELVEVCFARNGTTFHLYMMPRASGEALSDAPTFLADAGGVAAVWSDGVYDYALAGKVGVETLRHLL